MPIKKIGLLSRISKLNPSQIADYLEKMTPKFKLNAARILSKEQVGLSLIEMEEDPREELLEKLKDKEIAEIVKCLKSDDATDVINFLEENRIRRILKLLSEEKLSEIKPLLKFQEETAGGLMQTEYVAVRARHTVSEAIDGIRKIEAGEEIHNVFVVKGKNELVGIVPLRKLVTAKSKTKISSLMEKEIVSVSADLDQEQVAKKFKEEDLVTMPVVDSKNRLLGVITVDDVIDVLEEEATEDILRLAGVDEEETVFSSPFASVKRRTPWLALNLLIVMASASVIALFEDTIAALLLLAVFLPAVANLGGNAGTQTLAIMVRSLALGEISVKQYWKALKKEFIVGLLNGLIIGALLFALAVAWKGNMMVGIVLFLAMIANQITAALSGTLVPLIFKWKKIDPALASGIIITGFTDIMGFLAFLGIATWFLQMGLL